VKAAVVVVEAWARSENSTHGFWKFEPAVQAANMDIELRSKS